MAKDNGANGSSKKRKAEDGNAVAAGSKKARVASSATRNNLPPADGASKPAAKPEAGTNGSVAGDDAGAPSGGAKKKNLHAAHRRETKRARKAERSAQAEAEGKPGLKPQQKSTAAEESPKIAAKHVPVSEKEAERQRQHQDELSAALRAAKKQRRRQKKAEAAHIVSTEGPAGQLVAAESVRSPDTLTGAVATLKPETPRFIMSRLSAGRFIDHDPIFVRDPTSNEEMLIAATSREVQLLSLETSLPVRSCRVADDTEIVCLALGKHGGNNVLRIACSNRTEILWDWTSDSGARPKQTFKSVPYGMVDTEKVGLFTLISDGTGSAVHHKSKPLFTTKRRLESIQVLEQSQYVVAYARHAVVVGKKDPKQEGAVYTWREIPVDKQITCMDARLAASGNADRRDPKRKQALRIAIGNVEGQILLYDDISAVFTQQSAPQLPAPRILHWHRGAPNADKFSKDGKYLISGGQETVLVLWQLETGKKQFLPHLTSDIEKIVVSPGGDKYAVQMGDNSIMVLSTSELKPVANFAGLQSALPLKFGQAGKAASAKALAAAQLHPQRPEQLLVTVPATQPKSHTEAAGARSFLQSFDVRTSRHITRQALTRNNITDLNVGPGNTPIASPDVGHLSISHDGQWLATVDEWMPPVSDIRYLASDEGLSIEEQQQKRREVYLKIWRWDISQSLWTLSTRIDAPHARPGAERGVVGAGLVQQIVADPASTGFATVGEDGRVKIWRPRARLQNGVVARNSDGEDVVEWTCKRVVDLPAPDDGRVDSPVAEMAGRLTMSSASLAFSDDGSLLAVALSQDEEEEQPVIHYVGTLTGTVTGTKSIPNVDYGIDALAFLDRYLIAVSRNVFLIFDMVSDSLLRQFYIPQNGSPMLAVDRTEGTFAIATGSRVTVHKPSETEVLYSSDCASDITAILSCNGKKGYTLLFQDATVRTLSTGGGAQHRFTLPSTETQAVSAPTADIATTAGAKADAAAPAILTLPSENSDASGPMLVETEDDRPVVRPEHLASLFDVGQSFAMPPVKDMFDAVIGLFGRKPHATRVEVETVA